MPSADQLLGMQLNEETNTVMQDRADVVAAVVMRLLETGHKELVAALNNAFIKEGRYAPAIKVAGESSPLDGFQQQSMGILGACAGIQEIW